MSFPIAMQSGSSYNEAPVRSYYETDLASDLASGLATAANRWLKAVATPARKAPQFAAPATTSERKASAANPQTSAARLAELGADLDASVRSEVIFNPSTPKAVLLVLASDSDRFVASQAKAKLAA